ncbi:MAG: sigma-70 family RNA polymerase sigma factor [Verrucomicrobiales bacterium]|nr:sigma-70 family RNA polymerase sigma factor [Verrucomicrobiales bacterium]
MPDVTQLLQFMDAGDSKAADQLLPLVYEELRTLAAAKMAQEKPGQTLQATALVHEAWLRLAGTDERKAWNSRGHFFGAAAEAMRRILVERARRRSAVKRGGGEVPLELEAIEEFSPPVTDEGLLRVNDALDALAAVDPQMAELVKLRYFVGLSFEETGAALGIAVPTAKQWWAYARAWLSVELRKAGRKS